MDTRKTLALVIAALSASLSGCTTYNTQLHNPQTGQVLTCHESGWGLIGGAIATGQHNNCVHDAAAMGYSE